MPIGTENRSQLVASLVVEELHRKGLRFAVLCPGSRNTALTITLVEHGGFQLQRAHDERAAAFMALGWARASGQPALVLTTSGSAVAHLLPAAVEADQDDLPLLLLCADRPPELRHTGANQTVEHAGLLASVLRASLDLPLPDDRRPLDWLLASVDEAVDRCKGPQAGPVLLNLPFEKPLEPTPSPLEVACLTGLESWRANGQPWRAGGYGAPAPNPDASAQLARLLADARHPVFLLGYTRRHEDALAVAALASLLGVPLLVDLLSGLRLDGTQRNLIRHGDLLARLKSPLLERCDAVIQFGARLVSSALGEFVSQRETRALACLDPSPRRLDPTHSQALRLCVPAGQAADLVGNAFATAGQPDRAWADELMNADRRIERKLSQECDTLGTGGEVELARLLARELPAGHAIWCANSMPVRDMARWAGEGQCRQVLAARGASGIDGTLASALGACQALAGPLTLFCGDLSLLHDLNSLLPVARSSAPLTILVVNNEGGGIFHHLPVVANQHFHPWFDTPHDVDIQQVCGAMGLPSWCPTGLTGLRDALAAAWSSGRPGLVEFRCPPGASATRQRNLLEALASLT